VIRKLRPLLLLVAVLALAALPAVSQAGHGKHKGAEHGKSHKHKGKHKHHGHKRHCTIHRGFVVRGTLVSFSADDPATTDTDETSVTLTVTKANKHARRSGIEKGDEVTYTAATDAKGFKTRLAGYETGEAPKAGDKVRVLGKIEYTKKKCAPDTTLQERYGDVNVKRVRIVDVDS
jgi:hypothetical protein